MDANELTYGIEFETTIPASLARMVGAYSRPADASRLGLPAGWRTKSDCSIRAGRGRVGCEFVSPILRGAAGIRSVLAVLKRLNELAARVNRSTGCHVHVGWSGDDRALGRLVTLVANFEDAIYASTGTTRRQRGHWCGGVRRYGDASHAQSFSRSNRYHVLNLTNLRPGGKQTVEFRAFAGTLNATKAVAYVRMCLGMVERALKAKRITNWVAPVVKETSPIHRGGAGQTALTRLFYQLGWVKGRSKYCYGDVTADGAPDPKTIRAELMRLARQYDDERQGRRR